MTTDGGQDGRRIVFGLADLDQPVSVRRLFGSEGPVEIEIGAGRGDFLAAYALDNPGLRLIGIERSLVILRRAAPKLQRAGIENCVLVNAEVRYLFENYFLPGSVQAVHVYFPDPWPKKRHAKRRLFQPDTPAVLRRVLAAGGLLHVRTDVPWYHEAICATMDACAAFEKTDCSPVLMRYQTAFERRFVAQGKPVWRACYRAV